MLTAVLGCTGKADVDCLRKTDITTLYTAGKKFRFAPAMPVEGNYPLSEIRKGKWSKVPTIVGGQSCESCNSAARFGPPSHEPTKEEFDAALTKAGFNGTMLLPSGEQVPGVSPAMLEEWYAHRIATEGRWRTFARINSDSGHACSSALHAEALGSTSNQVWRYFFTYVAPGSTMPGATHGGDETWILRTKKTSNSAELALSEDMGSWWATLGATLDPNPISGNAPRWTSFVPGQEDGTMFMDTPPHLNSTVDTLRVECEKWKPYLGWQ